MRDSASKFRTQRDEVNLKIQQLQSQGRGIRDDSQGKRGQLQQLEERLQEVARNLGEDRRNVEARLRRLEWEMSTTPTKEMMKREEQVIKEIRELRDDLAAFDDFDNLEAQRLELRTELAALRLRNKDVNEGIQVLRNDSNMSHQKMVDELRKVDEFRCQADEAHGRVVAARDQLSQVRKDADTTRVKLQQLIRAREMTKRNLVREEVILSIKEKASRGGKLTFEEFKLLSEVGEKEEPQE